MEKINLPPNPSRVMEGLRDTGYNFNTAVADIVDNSIAANAKNISISIESIPNIGVQIYIADDGIGMSLDDLCDAMKYGSKPRKDPSSLGKFGLGLKTASTSVCRKLSVLSRADNGRLNMAVWDLDYVSQSNSWSALFYKENEIDADLAERLDDVAKNASGTLVVWEKVDRLFKSKEKINLDKAIQRAIENLKFHISMVYERFLDSSFVGAPTVKIKVNGDEIGPWDPLCLAEPNTQKVISTTIDITGDDGLKTKLFVLGSVIPRSTAFSSIEAKTRAKVNNDYQGFYIYRENRLIHYGDWLGLYAKEPHFSLCRIELSFNHNLDRYFNVDIKKSTISINDQIRECLQRLAAGPRREAERVYRASTAKQIQSVSTDSTAHDASNRNIEEKAKAIGEGTLVNVIPSCDGKVQIDNRWGDFTASMPTLNSAKKNWTRAIPTSDFADNNLWQPSLVKGNVAVAINTAHPFYQKVYYPILQNDDIVTGIDALLWSLAWAETAVYKDELKDWYKEMRAVVSESLKQLVSDLPDPKLEDGDSDE